MLLCSEEAGFLGDAVADFEKAAASKIEDCCGEGAGGAFFSLGKEDFDEGGREGGRDGGGIAFGFGPSELGHYRIVLAAVATPFVVEEGEVGERGDEGKERPEGEEAAYSLGAVGGGDCFLDELGFFGFDLFNGSCGVDIAEN